jgi:Lrp/AsnC family transcriptional regulator for asnA, asnC and gidA
VWKHGRYIEHKQISIDNKVKGMHKLSAQPEIDEIDVLILKTLTMNPRISFAEIAKDCKISTNSIRMRFNALKKNGVITGSTVILNPKSLGYEGIAFLAINSDINEEQNVLDFLDEIPHLVQNHSHIGKHNIVSTLVIKNIDEMVQTIDLVKSNPHVWRVDTAICTSGSSMYRPENLFFEPFKGSPYRNERLKENETKNSACFSKGNLKAAKEKINPSLELDKTDTLIIKALELNARVSFRKIAKELGISTKTVIKRFERLKKDVKPRLTITLNLKKIGYCCRAICCITVSDKDKSTIVFEKIARIPNVIMATRCVGDIEILAIAPFSNFEELFKLKQEIAKIPGIREMEILLERNHDTWPKNVFSKLI